jgi:hypothetical protein
MPLVRVDILDVFLLLQYGPISTWCDDRILMTFPTCSIRLMRQDSMATANNTNISIMRRYLYAVDRGDYVLDVKQRRNNGNGRMEFHKPFTNVKELLDLSFSSSSHEAGYEKSFSLKVSINGNISNVVLVVLVRCRERNADNTV